MMMWIKFIGTVFLFSIIIFAPLVILNIILYALYLKDFELREKYPFYINLL